LHAQLDAKHHGRSDPQPRGPRKIQRIFGRQPARSKDWAEFAKPAAPVMDFVLTVCNNAAGEVCPVSPGQPITAHFGVEDPSQFQGTAEEKSREFARVAHILKRRIELFTSLPLEKLDRLKLEQRVRDLGQR
jgi:arsenate reductase (thioredoxin)